MQTKKSFLISSAMALLLASAVSVGATPASTTLGGIHKTLPAKSMRFTGAAGITVTGGGGIAATGTTVMATGTTVRREFSLALAASVTTATSATGDCNQATQIQIGELSC